MSVCPRLIPIHVLIETMLDSATYIKGDPYIRDMKNTALVSLICDNSVVTYGVLEVMSAKFSQDAGIQRIQICSLLPLRIPR